MHDRAIDPFDPRLAIEERSTPIAWWAVLWTAAALLFTIACFEFGHAADALAPILAALRGPHSVEADGPALLATIEGFLFFCGVVAVATPHLPALWRASRATVDRADLIQAAIAYLALQALSTGFRPLNLGEGYQRMSLAPFGPDIWGLHRRLLHVVLADWLHLGGGLFPLFHALLTLALLALARGFLRRQGCRPPAWAFVSLATCSFAFHGFQFPGYPDGLVLILGLLFVLARLPVHGYASLMVLALLSHEALAVAVLAPLALWLPRRAWPAVAAPIVLYGVAWAASFGFDVAAGFHAQVDFDGASGPQLVLARPGAELLGLIVANKLLWLPVLALPVIAWRRNGAWAALRLALPMVAAVALCVPSYDTSRMAGMGAVVLLLAFAVFWPRLERGGGRLLLAANLVLPSPYVSPAVPPTDFGPTIWSPGLYLVYPAAVAVAIGGQPEIACKRCRKE